MKLTYIIAAITIIALAMVGPSFAAQNATQNTTLAKPNTAFASPVIGDIEIIGIDVIQERITLANVGKNTISIRNCKVSDITYHDAIILDDIVLKPGATVVLLAGRDAKPQAKNEFVLWNSKIWNNEGDIAYIYDPTGHILHAFGVNGNNQPVDSVNDSKGNVHTVPSPTGDRAITTASEGPIIIE